MQTFGLGIHLQRNGYTLSENHSLINLRYKLFEAMFLKKDSILEHLPIEIGERNLLILDALRFTIRMIEVEWVKLYQCCIDKSVGEAEKSFPAMFASTWNIIDNIYRFKNIYEQLDSNSEHALVQGLVLTKSFRHTFQHLDKRIDKSILGGSIPIYGALSWMYKNDNRKKSEVFIAISGIFHGLKSEVKYIEYIDLKEIVNSITLETVDWNGRIRIDLSRLICDFKSIIEELDCALKKQLISQKKLKYLDWTRKRDILMRVKN